MDIALWIIAALLSLVFLAGGVTKLARPRERLVAEMPVFADFSAGAIKVIAALEVAAGVGLIVPAVLDVVPVLVPLAAAGLVLLMAGAFVLHVRHRETRGIVVTLILLALAAFVAWGRFGPQPL